MPGEAGRFRRAAGVSREAQTGRLGTTAPRPCGARGAGGARRASRDARRSPDRSRGAAAPPLTPRRAFPPQPQRAAVSRRRRVRVAASSGEVRSGRARQLPWRIAGTLALSHSIESHRAPLAQRAWRALLHASCSIREAGLRRASRGAARRRRSVHRAAAVGARRPLAHGYLRSNGSSGGRDPSPCGACDRGRGAPGRPRAGCTRAAAAAAPVGARRRAPSCARPLPEPRRPPKRRMARSGASWSPAWAW